jgi:hypothetical protein
MFVSAIVALKFKMMKGVINVEPFKSFTIKYSML